MDAVKDFKKDKELYAPKAEPSLVSVPSMIFVAIRGQGNPNESGGEYQRAIPTLYGIQYAIKMSKKGSFTPKGYFDYVVPPLEGLWWLSDAPLSSEAEEWQKDKSKYHWISMIRLPEFVTEDVFKWACDEVSQKKKIDTSKAFLFSYDEGLCVQCMHIGIYDDEPKTLIRMDDFIKKTDLVNDISQTRRHHEMYLSDPRKVAPEKMKTILRIPVRNK